VKICEKMINFFQKYQEIWSFFTKILKIDENEDYFVKKSKKIIETCKYFSIF